MRLNKFAAVLALLAAGLPALGKAAAAEVAVERTQAITVNPLGLAFGLGNVAYEKALSKENSWLAGLNFASYAGVSLFGVGGSYRWWFEKKNLLQGWYAGPEVSVETLSYRYDLLGTAYTSSATYFTLGGQGGYQWIFDNGFTLGLGLGLSYWAGSINVESGAAAPAYGGLVPTGNLALGYAF